MRVLAIDGRVLTRHGNIVEMKPYAKMWGFRQAKTDGTVAAYDHIYNTIKEGFTNPANDGGVYNGAYESMYHVDCHWLLINLQPFGLSKSEAVKVITKVTHDNPILLSFVIDDELAGEITVVDGVATQARICLPVDAERKTALQIMASTIEQLDQKISETVQGVSLTSPPQTVDDKKRVVKVIHDWIIKKADFATSATMSYWQTTAFSALSSSLDFPLPDINRKATQCSGISSAMQLMCQRYGINCIYVSGNVGGGNADNHAWNIIDLVHAAGVYSSVPADWCGIDATFDEHCSDGELTIAGQTVSPWEFFLNSDAVYHDNRTAVISGREYSLSRRNSVLGYPVAASDTNEKYNGNQYYIW